LIGLESVNKYETVELLAKVTYSVIPAKAGIQNFLKILDSGSRCALYTMRCRAALARNDDFLYFSRVLQEPHWLREFSVEAPRYRTP